MLGPGKKPHPSSFWGLGLVKEEMIRRKSQGTPIKPATGRVFHSNYTTPELYFTAVLSNNRQQNQQQPHHTRHYKCTQVQWNRRRYSLLQQQQQQQSEKETGQSVHASNSNSSLNNMFKVATVVQQIIAELYGAVLEEDKIVVITKMVSKLMKHNSHQSSQAPQSLRILCEWPLEVAL
jgi:hypothetical protein